MTVEFLTEIIDYLDCLKRRARSRHDLSAIGISDEAIGPCRHALDDASQRRAAPRPARRINDVFAGLAALSVDWDSCGSPPIDPTAIQRAKDWLAGVIIVPCSDGGVQLEWHGEGNDVELVFRADGTFQAFAEDGPSAAAEAADPEVLVALVAELRSAIATAVTALDAWLDVAQPDAAGTVVAVAAQLRTALDLGRGLRVVVVAPPFLEGR